ncbi:MAG: hypothetical protein CMK29_06215 [Porticoccaceae bacterium]|nr:hypothetical protein [Porticoccaceae bacterium]OUW58467.1 MAG: hypothetical protein CBD57_02835 [Candidatus Pelagibacter sp. TMED197]|tara:strand:+ start:16537 stop:16905 length:369 start_codon:yes stop_codon:yes gene_type:complete
MANDFKRFAKPNVGTSTGASGDAVYSVPAGAGSTALESIIIGISICNKNAAERTVGIFLDNEDGSNDAYIVNGLKVPANTTVEIMQGNKIVVQNDGSNADVIRAEASAGSSIDVVLSVLEDV